MSRTIRPIELSAPRICIALPVMSMIRPFSYESCSVLPGANEPSAEAPRSRRIGALATSPSTETVKYSMSAGTSSCEPSTVRNRPPTTAALWVSSQAGAAPARASSAEA